MTSDRAIIHQTRVSAGDKPLTAACDFKLWLPADAQSIHCIFVINMRGAGRRLFHRDEQWRAMATRASAAMMYGQFEARSVRDNGYGESMLQAAGQFAASLGRPELKHAPFVLWGHSMGGRVAQDFVRFRPERVLAFHLALRAVASPQAFMLEEPAAQQVPALYLIGEHDRTPPDIYEHFLRARAANSPRAWARLPGQKHWPEGMDFTRDQTTPAAWKAWVANDVVIPWTEAMIALRLPTEASAVDGPITLRPIDLESGWLGDLRSGAISPYTIFGGNKAEACWFPTQRVAQAWATFCYGTCVERHVESRKHNESNSPARQSDRDA